MAALGLQDIVAHRTNLLGYSLKAKQDSKVANKSLEV